LNHLAKHLLLSLNSKRQNGVLDQNYTYSAAAKVMNISLSAINRWVKSLRMERQGKTPPGLPLTPEQSELREMRKRIAGVYWCSQFAQEQRATTGA